MIIERRRMPVTIRTRVGLAKNRYWYEISEHCHPRYPSSYFPLFSETWEVGAMAPSISPWDWWAHDEKPSRNEECRVVSWRSIRSVAWRAALVNQILHLEPYIHEPESEGARPYLRMINHFRTVAEGLVIAHPDKLAWHEAKEGGPKPLLRYRPAYKHDLQVEELADEKRRWPEKYGHYGEVWCGSEVHEDRKLLKSQGLA